MKSFRLLPLVGLFLSGALTGQEPSAPAAAPPAEPVEKRLSRTSDGCLTCHKGIEDAHDPERVSIKIGCTECHTPHAAGENCTQCHSYHGRRL